MRLAKLLCGKHRFCGIFQYLQPCLLYTSRHIEDFKNILSLVTHLKRFTIIPLALAYLARNVYVGQEVHLYFDDAVSLACLAASALHIKGKASFVVTARFCVLRHRKNIAYQVKYTGICRRIGARRPADGRLVDIHYLIHIFEPFDHIMLARALLGMVKPLHRGFFEDMVYNLSLIHIFAYTARQQRR